MGLLALYRFAVLTSERSLYFWFPLNKANRSVFVNGVALSLLTLQFFRCFVG